MTDVYNDPLIANDQDIESLFDDLIVVHHTKYTGHISPPQGYYFVEMRGPTTIYGKLKPWIEELVIPHMTHETIGGLQIIRRLKEWVIFAVDKDFIAYQLIAYVYDGSFEHLMEHVKEPQ